ncbi:hypothetical protein D3C87_1508150 [compost metagenome]
MGQLIAPEKIMLDGRFHKSLIAQGSSAGGNRGCIEVERAARTVQRIDDVHRAVHPADTQCGKTVSFGKRAGHNDVGPVRHQLKAGFIVVLAHIFSIGRIDHQKNMLRQAGLQAANFRDRNIGAGGIAWIGDEHHLRLRRHRR